jgi:2-polyprenyl-3-methyl-5-hydroxy-6-metoxy-1,4-benzoquinol methylase
MIYLADVPNGEEIHKFYQNYTVFKKYTPGRTTLYQRAMAQNNPYIIILENTGGIKNMSVCDIGCSNGRFLELIRHRGGRPYGVEIDANARNLLELKGIPTSAELVADQVFDIICLFQVLEHITHPRTLLTAISKALTTDGRLLVSVPNGGEFAKAGSSWVGFRVDFEHLNYFTLNTLSELLLQHNIYVEQFWEHRQPGVQRNLCQIVECVSLTVKIQSKLKNIFDNFLPCDIFSQGSFVLTVLARRI